VGRVARRGLHQHGTEHHDRNGHLVGWSAWGCGDRCRVEGEITARPHRLRCSAVTLTVICASRSLSAIGHHAVMGRGKAVIVARSLDDAELIERLAFVTASGSFTPPGWDGFVYRIEIDRIFAN
jgi:hypothetical protein